MALTKDGNVVAWGWDNFGQTEVPASATNVVAISAGFEHSLALTAAGTVVAWGRNSGGQTDVPTQLTNAIAIAGGGMYSMALKSDGTVVAWGDYYTGEMMNIPANLTNVVAIAAGFDYGLAIVGPAPEPQLLDPTLDNHTFKASLWTCLEKTYSLEFKPRLQEAQWTPLLVFRGTGGAKTMADTNAFAPQGFYRLRMDL